MQAGHLCRASNVSECSELNLIETLAYKGRLVIPVSLCLNGCKFVPQEQKMLVETMQAMAASRNVRVTFLSGRPILPFGFPSARSLC